MKNLVIIACMLFAATAFSQVETGKTALLVIDVQEFYFPGGMMELESPEQAAENAALLLAHFRSRAMQVVHIRHEADAGAAIHSLVEPREDEVVFTKTEVNSFKGTDLQKLLENEGVENLVICGMQTHMCVEAATRAASDLGYSCTLIADACATRTLSYNGREVNAADVHASTLSTLKSYATITDTQTFLKSNE